MQKIIKPIIIVLALIVIGAFIMYKINNKPIADQDNGSAITLYFRNDCPHCRNVEKFLEDNRVSEKVSFNQKEAGGNQKNAQEMLAKSKVCNISQADLGVPFLWDGENNKCYMGDVDIIDFFKKKLENSPSVSANCQELEKDTHVQLTTLLDAANYCNSDSDCIDNRNSFDCCIGCFDFLMNKNADTGKIKELINGYYDKCPKCSICNLCGAPKLTMCRNKKCITDNVLPE